MSVYKFMKKRGNEIARVAARLFLEKGYDNTSLAWKRPLSPIISRTKRTWPLLYENPEIYNWYFNEVSRINEAIARKMNAVELLFAAHT